MSQYYYAAPAAGAFSEIVEKVRTELQNEGFGVLTEIDVQAVMKKRLDVDMPAYLILGACNPHFAYKALQAEGWIGTMLPCNVIVRAGSGGTVEVAAVDPIESMASVDNAELADVAEEVRGRLRRVVDRVAG